mmetsp:Transcript_18549/g.41251  ORF Transcript_18549/g.41251 Transcript_18549/m.41251 type:complete len:233 (+) Transcript_18549:2641-3339(+)
MMSRKNCRLNWYRKHTSASPSRLKYTEAMAAAKGTYCADTARTCSRVSPVRATSALSCVASALTLSRLLTTRSSSRIAPCTALIWSKRASCRSRSLADCSPCSLSTSLLRLSTSGLSDFRMRLRAWDSRLAGVTVKLTMVTREQRSGLKRARGFLVSSTSMNCGEKSISSAPRRISVRPPVRCSSLFSTGLSTGSSDSTSRTSRGVPNRIAEAKVFMKDASRKDVWTILRAA